MVIIKMKIKITAAVILSLILGAAIANTILLGKTVEKVSGRVGELDIGDDAAKAEAEAKKIYEEFKCYEKFMSLTVNHGDLTNIEEMFAEMIGYLSVGDGNGARVAKSRLSDALSHLRRLSGVNIDSVI